MRFDLRELIREHGRTALTRAVAGGTSALPLRLAGVLIFFGLAAVAHGQSVRWESDPGNPSSLQLVFEECAPEGRPELPAVPGATFTYVGESQNVNIVNFQMSRSVTVSYLVRSRQGGPVQIPAFTVKTNKGAIRVPAFNTAAAAPPVESLASSRLVPERTSVWAGEVFGLNYEITASRRTNPQINQTFEWNAAPLVTEDWSKPQPDTDISDLMVNGERRVRVVFRTRAIAPNPGTVRPEAATHVLTIQTGTVGFGFLSQPRMEAISVTSDQPTIQVRPLPAAPAGFSGAVGQFQLASKVVPENAAVGEPVTWTLELSGTGNWPHLAGLPSREVSNDFQVVQPKARRVPVEGKLFDATLSEDVVLVPTRAGTYALGPVSFSYFDPKTGRYQTVTAPRTNITIAPPAAPQFAVAGTGVPNVANETDPVAVPGLRPAATPRPPTGLPRDPLPGTAEANVPLRARTFALWLLAPMPALLLLWFGLAYRRARETDPVRARREASIRISNTLRQLASADPVDRPKLLLEWQRDTARLWQIPHAAPPAAALPDSTWAALWTESERALYGANSALPDDWVARAEAALAAKRLPGFQASRVFRPQNLFPFAAALAVGLVVAATAIAAATRQTAAVDPVEAYRKGDFAAAEKAWRARLEQAPTDWIARHNLALALSQQDRPGEAAGHAAAALVQRPGHPSVQWHFGLASERAGFVPAPLAPFLRGTTLGSFGGIASAFTWQAVAMAAVLLAALAVGWMLVEAYRLRRTSHFRAAGVVLAFALLAVAAAATGWQSYGMAADPRAVIVARNGTLRSIPTEADTTQKTTPLAAGSTALVEKTFLGWVQLAFDNGQTGWVRKEDIVRLWK
jgi:hypothetical protein